MLADKSTSISLRDIDDAYVEAKAYYGNLLAGMDKDMLPLDDVEGKAEDRAQFFWSSDVDVQAVKEFCAQHDFTEKAFFNACFAYVLTKFTGRDEAFYATVYDGRNDAGSAQTATLPEKTFPVLLTVEDEENIVAFVDRMGQQLSASMAHAGFSFVDIAHEYDLTAELIFAYQGEVPAEENNGEKKDSASLPADESPARLCIEVHIRDGKAVFGCAYRSDCYIDTVINCAASVKHFAHDSRIEDINIGGAKNVIAFCLEHKARMIQTSTMSVVEMGYKDSLPANYQPTEQMLYFGQDLTNKYVHSKFLAERAVLEAVLQQGLSAKIMRYGNLSALAEDGEFQINFNSNAAMGVLEGYASLGCAAYDRLDDTMEFSPIDVAAKATAALAQTPEACRIFHVITDQYIPMI